MSRSPYDDVTERDWLQQILDAFAWHGWRVVHFRTSMERSGRWSTPVQADGVGWPDIFAVHPVAGDALAVELKTERGKASPEQLQWLAWLEVAGIEATIWRPSQVDEALARIAAPQRRVRAESRSATSNTRGRS